MWSSSKYVLCIFKIFILIETIKARLIEPGEDVEKPIQYGCVNYDMANELLTRVKFIETVLIKVNSVAPGSGNGELSSKDHEKITQNIKDAVKALLENQQGTSNNGLSKDNLRTVLEAISESLRGIKEAQAALQSQTKVIENKVSSSDPKHDEGVLKILMQTLEVQNGKLAENLELAKILQQQNLLFLNTMNNQTIEFQMNLAELKNNFKNDLMPNLNQDLKNLLATENLALKNALSENSKQIFKAELNDVKQTITSQTSKCDGGNTKSELQEFITKSIKDALKDQQKIFLESLQKQSKGENLKFSEKYLASATGICNAKNGLPENCEEALRGNPQCEEGVYLLYVPGFNLQPFFAYCLPDYTTPSLPAWTLVQRRQNGYFSFLRGWNDYRDGFGDVQSSYWLGLKYIHALTSRQNYELRADMEDWQGLKRFATYDKFVVGSEENKFPLSLLGKFRGNAGDSLTIHAGQKFTTIDSDNDQRLNGNCAKDCAGGWWYVDCHVSNPNGIYNSTELYKGINWKSWKGYKYSYKSFSLAIRPKKV